MLWLWVLAQEDGLRLSWPYFAALGLCVWSIYLLDRVIDGQRLRQLFQEEGGSTKCTAIPMRHRYSASHPRLFIAILSPVALALGYLIFWKLPFQSFVIPAIGASSFVWLYIGISASSIRINFSYIFVVLTLSTGLVGAVHLSFTPRILCGITLIASCIFLLRQGGWNASSGVIKAILCGTVFATGVALPVLLHTIQGVNELVTHSQWLILSALFSLNCLSIHLSEAEGVKTLHNQLILNSLRPLFIPACALLLMISVGISSSDLDASKEGAFYLLAALSVALLAVANLKFGKHFPEAHRVLVDVALIAPPLALLVFRGV